MNGLVAQSNTQTAATGFWKAYSALPFIGQILAMAGIALMMKSISSIKLAGGGLVDVGPSGVDKVPAWLTRKEFVMPVEPTRQWLPELEAMRNGTFGMRGALVPSAAGAAAGPASISVSVPIMVGPGSLILADNDLSVRRFANRVSNVIERRVKKTYEEL